MYLALDVTTNCICEIHGITLDGFNLNTAHKLSSKEKKILTEPGFKPGAASWKQECYLCATQPPCQFRSYTFCPIGLLIT